MKELDVYDQLLLDWASTPHSLRSLVFDAYHAGYYEGEHVGEERGKRIQKDIQKRKKKP